MIDFSITQALISFSGKILWIDKGITLFGQYAIYLMLIVLLALFSWNTKKHLRLIFEAFLAALLSRLVIVELIRLFVHRTRPYEELGFSPLITKLNEFPDFFSRIPFLSDLTKSSLHSSFPSGHAALAFAVAMVVFLHNRAMGILFFIAALLMGLARIYGGVHWFSDVAGGAMVGILSGIVTAWTLRRIKQELERKQVFRNTN